VQGLKSAKEIWDVLKTTHEGDEVTKITKRETIEGELMSIHASPRGGATSDVQPAQDLGEPSAQPREHKVG
jgi:predicted ATPase